MVRTLSGAAAHGSLSRTATASWWASPARQDAPGLHAREDPRSRVQPHPVHARPHARRHHRHGDPRGDPVTGKRALRVRARADLREHGPGGRNQPHAAQDAGRAARKRCRNTRVTARRHDAIRSKPPFFVLATQNPIELEGTYPLPEAQLDRFMFHISWISPTSRKRRRSSRPRRARTKRSRSR